MSRKRAYPLNIRFTVTADNHTFAINFNSIVTIVQISCFENNVCALGIDVARVGKQINVFTTTIPSVLNVAALQRVLFSGTSGGVIIDNPAIPFKKKYPFNFQAKSININPGAGSSLIGTFTVQIIYVI